MPAGRCCGDRGGMAAKPRYIGIGQIVKAVALEGEVEIKVHTDFPDRFAAGAELLPTPPLPEARKLCIDKVRWHSGRLVVKFGGVEDRSQAENLVGRWLEIPVEETAALPSDSFWVHEIVGLRAVTEDGLELGEVVDVIRTGANDVYVVARAEGETLVPATKEAVLDIDIEAGRMTVRLLPGMAD